MKKLVALPLLLIAMILSTTAIADNPPTELKTTRGGGGEGEPQVREYYISADAQMVYVAEVMTGCTPHWNASPASAVGDIYLQDPDVGVYVLDNFSSSQRTITVTVTSYGPARDCNYNYLIYIHQSGR